MQNSYSKVHISIRLKMLVAIISETFHVNKLMTPSSFIHHCKNFVNEINEAKIVPICLFIGLTFCRECLTDATFINLN